MKFGQMSINKLVIHLEIAVLGFVLIVLLLSALDQGSSLKNTTADGQTEQAQTVTIAPGAIDGLRTELFTDVHVPPRQREVWLGDLDGMLKRGQLRVLIPFSRTFFFRDKEQEFGLSVDILKRYEQFLSEQVAFGDKKTELVFLPTPKEHLVDELIAGKGDIAVADINLEPEQENAVKLVSPVNLEIREILVTGPHSPQFKNIFNLSGQEITLREKSPYAASLQKLNNTLKSIGKKPVIVHFADTFLQDEDLIEMTAAGLLPMTVVDSHVGEFWASVFHNLKLERNIAFRTAKEISWVIRADNHLLQDSVNFFKKNSYIPQNEHRELIEYYRKKGGFLHDNLQLAALERYHSLVPLFEEYGQEYKFPSLLLAALAYQESKLDASWMGEQGKVGLMGVDPSALMQEGLGADLKQVRRAEENIQAATDYLRFLADHYFSSSQLSELDRNLMAIASYASSPEQIIAARKKAALAGYDPDIWFGNVETALLANQDKDIAQHVRNIYNYFKAYEYFLEKNVKQIQQP
ncbi:MAG: transglycosylase SLT domain-containing protein [Candidatus Electrothrix aestuarii]|uniref:Transglycosylase SLT domain-containing protein n=1 Tax=Candidatus Electrothrix aestuarii TaxID=3062594 RepID=A0AAU8LUM3_9BACT|nr:transglycosylase SLT domain-containing protein [Candidatus Electrothrix aestuarii]